MNTVNLAGSFLSESLGVRVQTELTSDTSKVIDLALRDLATVGSSLDLQVEETAWLVLSDQVSDFSATLALAQVLERDLASIASYLSEIDSLYRELGGLANDSTAYAEAVSDISQKEADLSYFIGERSLRISDLSLIATSGQLFNNTPFRAIDIDAGTASTDQDTFSLLDVDLGKVLTSRHEVASCPICRRIFEAQLNPNDGWAISETDLPQPGSDEAAATYTSNVTGATTIAAAGTSYVDAIRGGYIWDLSSNETLSYSYYNGNVGYDSSVYSAVTYNAPLGASVISSLNLNYLDQAFSAWDNAAEFSLEYVAESGSTVGELRSAYTTRTYASASSAAYAYYPNSSVVGGDIWYIDDQSTNLDFSPGGYGYYTALHEIGHALGLSHSFDGGSASGSTLPTADDIQRNTVMTYTQYDRNQYWVNSGGSLSAKYFYATTPGIYDVAAMEHLYGANTTTNTTNTTYSFANWTASQPLYFQTIVDAGGADTIDASAQTRSSIIDLTPGTFSSIGIFTEAQQEAYWSGVLGGSIDLPSTSISSGSGTGVASRTALYTGVDNVGIAFSATIENAIGGAGDDTITGNSANNALKGGAGDDTINGVSGTNTAVFSGNYSDYTISTGASITVVDNNTIDGDDGTDTLTNISFLEFADLTYDLSLSTTASTGAGAIAQAVAGSAYASVVSFASSSSGDAGGGGGGLGFGGNLNTAQGRANFARFKAKALQLKWEKLAKEGYLASPHLLAAENNQPNRTVNPNQVKAIGIALDVANTQKADLSLLAKSAFANSELLVESFNSDLSLVNTAQDASSLTNLTATKIASSSDSVKAGLSNTNAAIASNLLAA